MQEFISQHADAFLTTALGGIGGALLTLISQYLLGKRAYNLRLWEKLTDKRIEAHLHAIEVATDLRRMFPLLNGEIDEDGPARAPHILNCKEDFENWWYGKFGALVTQCSPWLSTTAKREINFLQDYLVTLHQNMASCSSEKYAEVGRIIRQDFVDLSSSLEKKAYQFFEKDIRKLKLAKLRDWHKYKKSETIKRLSNTVLLKKADEIHQIVSG